MRTDANIITKFNNYIQNVDTTSTIDKETQHLANQVIKVISDEEVSLELPSFFEIIDNKGLSQEIKLLYHQAIDSGLQAHPKIQHFCKKHSIEGQTLENIYRIAPQLAECLKTHPSLLEDFEECLKDEYNTDALLLLVESEKGNPLPELFNSLYQLSSKNTPMNALAFSGHLELLTSMPISGWEQVITLRKKVLESPIADKVWKIDFQKDQLIECLAALDPAEAEETVKFSIKLFTPLTSRRYNVYRYQRFHKIITLIGKLPPKDRKEVFPYLEQYAKEFKNNDEKFPLLLEAIIKLPSGTAAPILRQLESTQLELDKIIGSLEALSQQPSTDTLPLLELVLPYSQKHKTSLSKLIMNVGAVPPSEREELLNLAVEGVPFINSGSEPYDDRYPYLIAILRNISPSNRRDVLTKTTEYFESSITRSHFESVLNDFSQVPQSDRESVLSYSKILKNFEPFGNGYAHIIRDVAAAPASEREAIMEHTVSLMSATDITFLFKGITSLAPDNRDELIQLLGPVLKGKNGRVQGQILQSFSELSSARATEILEICEGRFAEESMEYNELLFFASMFSPEENRDLKPMIDTLIQKKRNRSYILDNFFDKAQAFNLVDEELRKKLFETFHQNKVSPVWFANYVIALDPIALVERQIKREYKVQALALIDPQLHNKAYNLIKDAIGGRDDYLKLLLADDEFRESFEPYLSTMLKKSVTNKPRTLKLCKIIITLYREGLISEDSPLVLQALELELMHSPSERNNPKNPIRIFKELEKESAPLSVANPSVVSDDSINAEWNLATLRDQSKPTVYQAKDLEGFQINAETLPTLYKDLEKSIKSLPAQERGPFYIHVGKKYVDREGSDPPNDDQCFQQGRHEFGVLVKHLLGKNEATLMLNCTRNTFEDPEEVIPKEQYQVFYILDAIKNTSDLMQRAEMLLGLAKSVQLCGTAQKEGIDIFYRGLQPETTSHQHQLYPKLSQFFYLAIQDSMNELLTNTSFLKSLSNSDAQLVHQTLLLKNRLAPHIGYEHTLSFDPNTHVLPDRLLQYKLEDLFNHFFEALNIETIIKRVEQHYQEVAQLKKECTELENYNKNLMPENLKEQQTKINTVAQKMLRGQGLQAEWKKEKNILIEMQEAFERTPEGLEIKKNKEKVNQIKNKLLHLEKVLPSAELFQMFGIPKEGENNLVSDSVILAEIDEEETVSILTKAGIFKILKKLEYLDF